ncbi:hypothetical protein [Anaerosacchariphilus polymeriproducens]|uniref:Uncharacterized protein n=1 Tax=Anaerosacchariphilus polymeriproducens TaxID=1812858 RepID=A0A371AQM9_9FIRM|nr:hypothetical protein [Anaerosacchariphilus polymeriproducens]RDU21886.1 hypothetical protein DWV06_18055 [Anaerosacchariphilus polymeriproducens]
MKIKYNMELNLPSNSVALENAEMSYVDGGCHTEKKCWGKRIFFSAKECSIIARRGNIKCNKDYSSIIGVPVIINNGCITINGSTINISNNATWTSSCQSGMYIDFNSSTCQTSYGFGC